MIEKVYEVFGPELPDKDTFFATTANPMCLLDLRNQFKTWDVFVHEYHLFVKDKLVTKVPEKPLVAPPVLTKAATNETE